MFLHGFKGQNESCRELQNGSELGPSEGELASVGGFGRFLEGFGRSWTCFKGDLTGFLRLSAGDWDLGALAGFADVDRL